MNFTPDELHRHIQLSVFGRQRESHERFNQLQDALHELVDRPSDYEIIRTLIERVKAHVGENDGTMNWYGSFYISIMEEIGAMELGYENAAEYYAAHD